MVGEQTDAQRKHDGRPLEDWENVKVRNLLARDQRAQWLRGVGKQALLWATTTAGVIIAYDQVRQILGG